MLQKILPQQLRMGMYVERLGGSWLQHPFWRGSFLIRREQEIEAICDSGVDEVWIDLDKGLAPSAEPVHAAAEPQRTPAAAQPAQPVEAAAAQALQPASVSASVPASAAAPQRVPMGDEVVQARRIYDSSRPVLRSMFEQARLGRAIDTAGADDLVEQISESVQRNPWALLSVARLKLADEYTYMHSVAVCALMIALARQMGLDARQTRDAGMAGMLHDVGKALIPAHIINKPGKLDAAELQIVRTHPERGHELLQRLGGLAPAVLDVCLNHHEKMDGSGYPHGAPSERISTMARMAAVCDVYDAITSNRSYKPGWDPGLSLRRMAQRAGTHFDRQVFQHFVKSIGIYPVGSFVRLESGLLGVVVEQGADSLLQPQVRVLMDARTRAAVTPRLIDLAAPGCDQRIAGLEDPQAWGLQEPGRYL